MSNKSNNRKDVKASDTKRIVTLPEVQQRPEKLINLGVTTLAWLAHEAEYDLEFSELKVKRAPEYDPPQYTPHHTGIAEPFIEMQLAT